VFDLSSYRSPTLVLCVSHELATCLVSCFCVGVHGDALTHCLHVRLVVLRGRTAGYIVPCVVVTRSHLPCLYPSLCVSICIVFSCIYHVIWRGGFGMIYMLLCLRVYFYSVFTELTVSFAQFIGCSLVGL